MSASSSGGDVDKKVRSDEGELSCNKALLGLNGKGRRSKHLAVMLCS